MQQGMTILMRRRQARVATLAVGVAAAFALLILAAYHIQLERQAGLWLNKATELERTGEYATSAEALERYIALRPNDTVALRRLADLQRRLAQSPGEKGKVLALYGAVLRLDPTDVDAQAWRAHLLLELGDLPAAHEASRRLLSQSPLHAVALRTNTLTSIASAAAGAAAVPMLCRAVMQNPGDDVLLMAVAHHCCRVARDDSAFSEIDAQLTRLALQNPQRTEPWLLRYVLHKHFALPYADDDLRQALRLPNQSSDVAVLLAAGERSLEHRKWATARHYFRQAVLWRPHAARAQLGLGLSYRGQKRWREACAVWERAVVHLFAPDRVHLYDALFEARLEQGQRDEALGWLERSEATRRYFAHHLDPITTARIHLLRARARIAAGDHGAALRHYQAWLESLPADSTRAMREMAHREVARCYEELERWDFAAVHYAASAQRGGGGESWSRAAQCWEIAGAPEQALVAYRTAAALEPETNLQQRFFYLLCRTGRIEEAEALAATVQDQHAKGSVIDGWKMETALQRARQRRRLWRPLALLLARQGNAELALRLCLTQPPEGQDPDDAVILAAVLARAPEGAPSAGAAEVRLERIQHRHAMHVELLAAMGTLRQIQHRVDEARDYYEQALLYYPYHGQTLNNLALLIKQQPETGDRALAYIERALLSAGRNEELLDSQREIAEAIARPASHQAAHIAPTGGDAR